MIGQEKKFSDFVASRSLAEIENWAETLRYPVLRAGGTKPIPENAAWIAAKHQALPYHC